MVSDGGALEVLYPGQALCEVPLAHFQEPDTGLQSGPGPLNHSNQKVNTVHESITQGEGLGDHVSPEFALSRQPISLTVKS